MFRCSRMVACTLALARGRGTAEKLSPAVSSTSGLMAVRTPATPPTTNSRVPNSYLDATRVPVDPITIAEHEEFGRQLLKTPELKAQGLSYLRQAKRMQLTEELQREGVTLPSDYDTTLSKSDLLQHISTATKSDPKLLTAFTNVMKKLDNNSIPVFGLLDLILAELNK